MHYGAIDLGARHSHLCVIDGEGEVRLNRRIPNCRQTILQQLAPFRAGLKVVVESTFNWYWLIDLLQDNEIDVCLAHTLGLAMITHAKVKTDRRDALALARRLRMNDIPTAFIYPRPMRGLRDLMRKRNQLVRQKGNAQGSVRRLLLRHGITDHSRNDRLDRTELDASLDDPLVRPHAHIELQRMALIDEQIAVVEKQILEVTDVHHGRDFRRLLKLPGVGVYLGLTILLETGPVERFTSSRRYSSYCRVVPGIYQSGAIRRRRGRQSNQGNPHLKWAYNQAAMYAVRYYPRPREFFERHLAGHTGPAGKVVAYNTVAHRLAVAAYRVLRDQTHYQEELAFGR